MASKLVSTDIEATRFVPSTSRYGGSKVYYLGELSKICFETYKRPTQVQSPTDKSGVITPGREYRPDLISQDMYGTPDFWWKIMEYNNIFDIFDFKAGRTIRLPENVF